MARVCLVVGGLGSVGCGGSTDLDPAGPQGVTVQATSIPTVMAVSWSTTPLSIGYVEYGLTSALEYSTPMQAESQAHLVNLVGLLPNATYYYRVITWGGGDAGAGSIGTFQTGALPGDLPAFTVEGTWQDADHYLVAPLNRNSVSIIDNEGRAVWARSDSRGLEIQRASLSVDKQSVLYNAAGPIGTASDSAALVRVSLDGGTETPTPIPGLGADFTELADGTVAALVADVRDFQGTAVRGDKIVEIVGGVPTDLWSTWDCFDPAVDVGENIAQAWTLANAFAYLESSAAYYVSLRNFSSIVKVDRATGSCQWVFGSTASTVTFTEGQAFQHQHGVTAYESGGLHLVVMDNDGAGNGTSRVLDYAIDETALTATQSSEYTANPPFYTASLGLANKRTGNITFVNWGEAGVLERVDAMNQVQWRLTAAGAVFGYHTLATTLYAGTTRTPSP